MDSVDPRHLSSANRFRSGGQDWHAGMDEKKSERG